MRKKNGSRKLGLVGLAWLAGLWAASAQTVAIPASFAHPADQVDASAPGFKVRTVQATTAGGTFLTSVTRTESLLAGTLIDSTTGKPYENIADLSVLGADGYYHETGVIDYEQGGGSSSGLAFPGVPGTKEPENLDNIALEALTYVVLQPGLYSMVVNSDDGFRVTSAPDPRDQFNAIILGQWDATRGSADTVINFTVPVAGAYGFRLVYFENGGGANVSWYSAATNDASARVLINGGDWKAYRQLKGAGAAVVDLASPSPGQTAVAPKASLLYRIVDGSPNPVAPNTVQLLLDGTKVAATVDKSGAKTTVSFAPTNPFTSLSTHKVKLIFGDTAATPNYQTNELQFTVAEYANLVLPAPLYLETFDSFPEQTDPPAEYSAGSNKWTYHGWTSENYTDPRNSGWDLDDPNSDAFLGWVVISKDRVLSIGTAGKWEGPRRVNNVAEQYVNGQQVTTLMSNNFFYAESDQRGGSQVQFLYSPDWDLTGKSNVYVYYNSMYEQNQDSIGSVEYSIDLGKTWLPILYMVDRDDLIKDASGAVDGYATLSATQSDTAHWLDPLTGEEKGLTYGSFVGVASNLWANLGPYISGRINDDPVESKRVEFYRIPQADGQAKVRFRFAQAGTGSWYFGIDDFGLYSVAPVVAKPAQPVVSALADVSFTARSFTASSSAFKGFKPEDTHALSVWQIASGPAFTKDKGLAVPLTTITSASNLVSVAFTTERLLPGATYYVSVQYQDQAGGKSDFAEPVPVKVSALPAPIVLETFENTADYGVPAGWTATNQTDVINDVTDPNDINSNTYANWTVAPFDRLVALGGGRADNTNVVTGKSLYAESDNRSGNQIQVIVTPDFNLTGKQDVWLAFKSSYVQNQDSMAVAEYSIDQGGTWLPIVYMLDDQNGAADVYRNADGSIDAVKTLTTTATDIAKIFDETGQRVTAGKYGDFVLAKPLDSLGTYISGRINDDKAESRRYERYRLTAADNQAKVRIRFVQAGTGSWWWGLDDIGFYSIPSAPAGQPNLSIAWQAGQAVITFEGTLQAADTVTGTYTDIAATSPYLVTPAGTSKFYRAKK